MLFYDALEILKQIKYTRILAVATRFNNKQITFFRNSETHRIRFSVTFRVLKAQQLDGRSRLAFLPPNECVALDTSALILKFAFLVCNERNIVIINTTKLLFIYY